jgi:hypothetical protein
VCVGGEEGASEEEEGEGEGGDEEQGEDESDTLLIFHNNSGPMCLAALAWLDGAQSDHPALVVEERLTYEAGVRDLLVQLEGQYQTSQGVSTSFEYLPIVFFKEQAFSGFDNEIASAWQELLLSEGRVSP